MRSTLPCNQWLTDNGGYPAGTRGRPAPRDTSTRFSNYGARNGLGNLEKDCSHCLDPWTRATPILKLTPDACMTDDRQGKRPLPSPPEGVHEGGHG